MSIDRRITNGLAWAGVVLVVGVPLADVLSAQFIGAPEKPLSAQVAVIERVAPIPAPLNQRPAAAPVAKPETQLAVAPQAKPVAAEAAAKPTAVAAVAPAKPAAKPVVPAVSPTVTPAAQTADAVDAFLNSGRDLPSYITESSAAPVQVAAVKPSGTATVTAPAVAIDPIEVASIAPQKVAPVPMPLSMRPAPIAVALATEPTIVIPPGLTPAQPTAVVPPSDAVTAADLEDWETGPLADFLAQRQGANAYIDPGYDAGYDGDGFFLDEGPNRQRRDRIVDREADPFYFFVD
ncbi:MAG TPA: hypothetical protein VGN60_09435 [Devosia sp.]|jgi:hypothetical protein|nr:hypothetical protein [Devosia sp.]